MAQRESSRFYLIDALRGVAALWVVLFHAYEGGHIEKLASGLPHWITTLVFEIGYLGVAIFFVISGFVIAHSTSRDHITPNYFARFTLRRSIRLDPPYWGSIVLVLGLAAVSNFVRQEPVDIPPGDAIVAHLFYLQDILGYMPINIIYWTLCLEIQFYLVFCLLMMANQYLKKLNKHSLLIIFVPAACISILWPTEVLTKNLHPGLFFPYWYGFLLGVFAYWSWRQTIPRLIFYSYFVIVFIASFFSEYPFKFVVALTVIVVHECAVRQRLNILNYRWLQFLGLVSYSLYLTHPPITGANYFVFEKILGNTVFAQIISLALSTIICVVFAYVFWWVFERWSIGLSKKITLHR